MPANDAIQKAIGYLDANKERFLKELFDYLRIASISAQKEHEAELRKAAEWTRDRCKAAGL
ncbi:MAG TPA: peptidase M20, partial [Phycisphaerae bacterium]|nr:peptidase M20 [Phycisphaerae bacterium]